MTELNYDQRYFQKYYLENKERLSQQAKERYRGDRERILARSKAYKEANKDKVSKYNKRYASKNYRKELINNDWNVNWANTTQFDFWCCFNFASNFNYFRSKKQAKLSLLGSKSI